MPPIYPDLKWYLSKSEQKRLSGRCPYTSVLRCPRYFDSVALLSDARVTTKLSTELHDSALSKWQNHELAPATKETATSITGWANPRTYSRFCPEVAYDTFQLFAITLIRTTSDPTDRQIVERIIEEDPAQEGKDWRWSWSHIEPLHFSDCPLYAKLHQEIPVSNITFNAPVTGNINIAGHSISASVMSLSIEELLTKIETSTVSPSEKEVAKSKLAEFLSHPVVAAIMGGFAGKIAG